MEPFLALSLIATPPPAAGLGAPMSVPSIASTTPSSLQEGGEPTDSEQAETVDAPATAETMPDSRFDAQASTDSEPEPRRSIKFWAIGIAASVTILAISAMLYGPSSKPVPAPRSAAAEPASSDKSTAPVTGPAPGNATPERASVAAPLPHPSAPGIVPAQIPTPAPADGKFHASIQGNGQSWVVACADNKILFAKLFTKGTLEEIQFVTRAIVRVGRSTAVQIAVNGKSVVTPEDVGQVRIIELTPGGSNFLDDGTPNDCTSGR